MGAGRRWRSGSGEIGGRGGGAAAEVGDNGGVVVGVGVADGALVVDADLHAVGSAGEVAVQLIEFTSKTQWRGRPGPGGFGTPPAFRKVYRSFVPQSG